MPFSFNQIMQGIQDAVAGGSENPTTGSSIEKLQETISNLDETEGQRIEIAQSLQQTIQSSQEVGETASEKFDGGLGSIIDFEGFTTDFAKAIITPELINSIENAESVDEFQELTSSLSEYVNQANEFQMQFIEGSITKNELEDQFNSLQEETIKNLEEKQNLQENSVDLLKEQFNAAQTAQEGFTQQVETANGFSEALDTGLGDAAAPIFDLTDATMAFKDTAMAAFNVWALGAAAIGLLIADFVTLNNATSNFTEQTGIAVNKSEKLVGNLAEFRRQAALSGVEIDDLVAATTTLIDEFGSLNGAANALQSTQSKITSEVISVAGRLRISGEEAASLITKFEDIASLTGTTRRGLEISAIEASNIAGVAPKQVFQDIADNAEKLATFSGESAEKITSAAARARQLGTNIGEIVGVQEQFLSNIPSTFQNISQASVITGIQFDSQSLVRSAAQGTAEFTETLSKELEQVNFDDLIFYEKQQLADSFNLTISQLQRISEQSKETEQSFQELTEQVESGDATFEEAFAASESFTALERLQNQFSSLLLTVSDDLTPIYGALESVLGLLASTIGLVADTIELLTSKISNATNAVGNFLGESETLTSTWNSVSGAFTSAFSSLEKVEKESKGAKASLAGFALEFKNIGSILAGGLVVTGMFKVGSAFVSTLGSGGDGGVVGKSISGFFDFFKKAINGIKGVLTSLVDLITGVLKSALKGIGQAFSAFAKALTPIANPATIAGLAAFTVTALGVAGAINILANGIASLIESLGPAREILAGGFADVLTNVSQAFLTLAENVAPVIETLVDGLFKAIVSVGQTAVEIIDRLFTGIVEVANVGPQIGVAAASIFGLAGALGALAGGGILSGLSSFVGVGFDDQLESIANYADPILTVANAVDRLVESIQTLASQEFQDKLSIASSGIEIIAGSPEILETASQITQSPSTVQTGSEIVESSPPQTATEISNNVSTVSQTTNQTEASPEMVQKLDSLIESNRQIAQLIQQGAFDVYLDGRKVTDQLRRRNASNSFVTSP